MSSRLNGTLVSDNAKVKHSMFLRMNGGRNPIGHFFHIFCLNVFLLLILRLENASHEINLISS